MQITSHIRSQQARANAAAPSVEGQAQSLLEQGKCQEAIELLNSPAAEGRNGCQALLGKAYFRTENYKEAAACLDKALQADPDNKELQGLRERAVHNEVSDIKVDRTFQAIDLKKLLGPPQPGTGYEVRQKEPDTWGDKIASAYQSTKKLLAYASGAVIGGALGLAANWLGDEDKAQVWTQWSRTNMAKGMLMLAKHRHNLTHHNRVNTYPEGHLVGFLEPGAKAPEWALTNRTYDGTFNDLENPKAGAAGVRFPRNVQLEATRVDPETILSPNPVSISQSLGTRQDGKAIRAGIANQLLSLWIQFMVHDWVDAGDPNNNDLHQIPLPADHPKRKELHMTHMLVGKSTVDPTRQAADGDAPTTYINHNTAWWDASQLYGNNEETARSLRSNKDGKLTMTADNLIPLDETGIEKTGFRRNMWVGLSSLHQVFAREHNRICDMLKSHHPDWSDEQLFLKARMGVAAIMAKIHTVEWTPAVLPNKMLNLAMNANWYGSVETLTKSAEDRKAVPWYNFLNNDEVIGGIVGNPKKDHPSPYGLAMEFLDVYRLHSLLMDKYPVYKVGEQTPHGEFNLTESRMKGSNTIMQKEGLGNLLYSFGKEEVCALTLNNYPTTLQDMSVPGFGFYDLMAVDILRARERGVPRYNETRRQLGLNEIKSFEDLTTDPVQLAKLKKEYENDIEKIDLLVGTLAESTRPEGFGFGETLFQVFILNASLRLQADRFFTDDYNAETYGQELLDYIDDSTMKKVLQRNVPELIGTDLDKVNNAFEVWDKDGIADPNRHPLEHAAKV